MKNWGTPLTQKARPLVNTRDMDKTRREAAAARREALLLALLTAARRHVVDLQPCASGEHRATAGHVQALRSAIERAPAGPGSERETQREELLYVVRDAAVRHMVALERRRPGLYRVSPERLRELLAAVDAADDGINGGHGR